MKKIIFFTLIGLIVFGCSKDDDEQSQIVGNWKLIESKSHGFQGEGSVDYSNKNIIYNFQVDGTLIVSGGENVGYPNGEYEYFFGEGHLGGTNDPKVLLVKINESKWSYDFSNGRMTLGQAYVDGPNLIFVRE